LEYFKEIWDIYLQPFRIFCVHFFWFWYYVPRKIWQPWRTVVSSIFASPNSVINKTELSQSVERNEKRGSKVWRQTFPPKLCSAGRVTRLGEISHVGPFALGRFLKMSKVAQIIGLLFPR
jgi:hypothetical protein